MQSSTTSMACFLFPTLPSIPSSFSDCPVFFFLFLSPLASSLPWRHSEAPPNDRPSSLQPPPSRSLCNARTCGEKRRERERERGEDS